MATIDEILNGPALSGDIDDVIIVEPVTRTLQVPSTELILGVAGDDNGERKYFRMPNVVGNDIDVSACSLRVLYSSMAADNVGYFPVVKCKSDENAVAFCWEISGGVTRYEGDVEFSIGVFKTVDGELENVWQTTTAIGKVLRGIPTDGVNNDIVQSDALAAAQYAANTAAGAAKVAEEQASRALEAATRAELSGGATFIPAVDAEGNLSWSNSSDLDNPETVNIRGPKGETGERGETGPKGETGATGAPGGAGPQGATYTPHVDIDGKLSWSNDMGLADPEPVNIMGPKGETGETGPQGLPGRDGAAAPTLLMNSPFTIYELPQDKTHSKYTLGADGKVTTSNLENCTEYIKCPKYLGWRLGDSEARLYLYVGTLDANGVFTPDLDYTVTVTSKNIVNYLNWNHNRFIEIDPIDGSDRYFYYCVDKPGDVTIVGCDQFPGSEMDNIAIVPNFIDFSGSTPKKQIEGMFYSVVLPANTYYAILLDNGAKSIKDSTSGIIASMNVSYEIDEVENNTVNRVIKATKGASFGYIPSNVGTALLTIPCTCDIKALTVYNSKIVKSHNNNGRRRFAKALGIKAIRDFNFESQQPILWNDSDRPMTVGRRFYGVPYSSRWRNAHFVGFEVSPETALHALNDKYSIAYDGAKYIDANGDVRVLEISKKSEISSSGGPGYGLVCGAFAMLMRGNPYPQTNRGFTFDSNFCITEAAEVTSGKLMVNNTMSHVVMVDEVYNTGYALYEAVDPCVAKTLHTSSIEPSYAASKTRLTTIDNYPYSVVNSDESGYTWHKGAGKHLVDFDISWSDVQKAAGNVRPWRGHKAVYGPYDKVTNGGSGVGVTIHNDVTTVRLFVPYIDSATGEEKWSTSYIPVDAGTRYLDLAKVPQSDGSTKDYITAEGTYKVDSGNGKQHMFRYYDHDTVTLSFDATGKAVFSHSDVEYAYARVVGYGGAFDGVIDTSEDSADGEPIVIAAGKCYPDLAANPTGRIKNMYAAIVADPREDCWGKFSCVCSSTITSNYNPSDNSEGTLGGISVTGAKVGQTVKIAEVDKNGVPTAWESVEFPGEEEYELISEVVCDGVLNLIKVEKQLDDTPLCLRKVKLLISAPASPSINAVIYGFFDDETNILISTPISQDGNHRWSKYEFIKYSDVWRAYKTEGYTANDSTHGAYAGTIYETTPSMMEQYSTETRDHIYKIQLAGSNGIFPEGTTVRIMGVRA